MLRILAFSIALTCLACAVQAQERKGGPAGDFDFYVLALSWSPSYCAKEGKSRVTPQCEARRNPGFVVHGLWPQFERGFPSYCSPEGRTPSRAAMESADDIFPDSGLARYEWRKHGTCSGESPSGYFEATKRARAMVTIPPELLSPKQDMRLSPLEVERAFIAANPLLRPDMLSVSCSRNQIDEVRLCLTKDLRRFRPCAEVDERACRVREITIPAAR